jgi:hypothetical protein
MHRSVTFGGDGMKAFLSNTIDIRHVNKGHEETALN